MKLLIVFAVLAFWQAQVSTSQTDSDLATKWTVWFQVPPAHNQYDESSLLYVCNVTLSSVGVSNETGAVSGVPLQKLSDLPYFLTSLQNRTYTKLRDTVVSDVPAAAVVSLTVNMSTTDLNLAELVKTNQTRLGTIQFVVQANRVGRSLVTLLLLSEQEEQVQVNGVEEVNKSTNGNGSDIVLGSTQITVVREMRLVDIIFRWVITAFIIFATFGMGCELDLKVIIEILKKPFPPLIGLFSQYVLMPLIAIGIGQIFLRSEEMKLFGFGLLALGCAPGGGGSNMWTILLGGDLNLSMTMTAISSTLALGMMPLWLYISAPLYIDVNMVQIPYMVIITQLIVFLVPTIFGVLAKTWKPILADKMKGPVRWGSLAFMIFMMTFGTWINWYMFRTIGYFPHLLPIGALLPWCGFFFGYIVAWILRQGHKRALTIAIETGIQNIGIPMIILRFSFPAPEGDIGAVMVIIAAMFTPFPLYIAGATRAIYHCVKKARGDDDKQPVPTEDLDEKANQIDKQVDSYLNRTPNNSMDAEANYAMKSYSGDNGEHSVNNANRISGN